MRVILTPKAAERIAIETGVVSEEPVDRWLLVSGEVETIATPAAAGAVAAQPAPAQPSEAVTAIPLLTNSSSMASAGPEPVGIVPVRVRVPAVDDTEAARPQATPVLVLEDDDDDDLDDDDDDLDDELAVIIIRPNGDGASALKAKPVEVGSTDGEAQYYELVNGGSHQLKPGQDVQVRVPHPDNGTPKKVIPFSAVIYSPDGKAWTYTVVEPLTYIRHPIDIDYVVGDRAVLKDGPAAGTEVVTTGTAELWGVETKNG
ncbi:MAG TPA: efflux RND transporter periplasmic adaptor subunit [Afifellaceae bacterium]|nr:efflux RND transporter periplasmic adaptor subunit [Afifellaceae bacterium]